MDAKKEITRVKRGSTRREISPPVFGKSTGFFSSSALVGDYYFEAFIKNAG